MQFDLSQAIPSNPIVTPQLSHLLQASLKHNQVALDWLKRAIIETMPINLQALNEVVAQDSTETQEMGTSKLIIASSITFAILNAYVAWHILTDMPQLEEWKKLVSTSLSLPQLVGMALWMSNDDDDTR